jgi:hypothetical protein
MSKNTIRRAVCALAVGLVLSAAPAPAAPLGGWRFAEELGRGAWTWIMRLVGGEISASSRPATVKTGCSTDPDGRTICIL